MVGADAVRDPGPDQAQPAVGETTSHGDVTPHAQAKDAGCGTDATLNEASSLVAGVAAEDAHLEAHAKEVPHALTDESSQHSEPVDHGVVQAPDLVHGEEPPRTAPEELVQEKEDADEDEEAQITQASSGCRQS